MQGLEHAENRRGKADKTIINWTIDLTPEALAGDLTWLSGAAGRDATKPLAMLITHFINHQTHHRSQVHCLLTALGAKLGDTDLFLMPEEYWP